MTSCVSLSCVWKQTQELTDVVLVVDDRVEGDVPVLYVPFRGLHVVGPLVRLDKTLKSSVHNRAMSKWALLAWNSKLTLSSKFCFMPNLFQKHVCAVLTSLHVIMWSMMSTAGALLNEFTIQNPQLLYFPTSLHSWAPTKDFSAVNMGGISRHLFSGHLDDKLGREYGRFSFHCQVKMSKIEGGKWSSGFFQNTRGFVIINSILQIKAKMSRMTYIMPCFVKNTHQHSVEQEELCHEGKSTWTVVHNPLGYIFVMPQTKRLSVTRRTWATSSAWTCGSVPRWS